MRYINKQKHLSSCGPIAVINTIKWLGGDMTSKNLDIFSLFDWQKNGMSIKAIATALKIFGVQYRVIINPTVQFIEKSLDSGNVSILAFRWHFDDHHTDHATFVYKNHKKCFGVANSFPFGTKRLSKKILEAFFIMSLSQEFPSVMIEIIP